MSRIILVRHAEPIVDESVPPARWRLSSRGAVAAQAMAETLRAVVRTPVGLIASAEEKAIETAAPIGGVFDSTVEIDDRLNEASKPWVAEGYESIAQRWLRGDELVGWEELDRVQRRMYDALSERIERAGTVVAVGHGLAIAALLERVTGARACEIWPDLRMPDALLLSGVGESTEHVVRFSSIPAAGVEHYDFSDQGM